MRRLLFIILAIIVGHHGFAQVRLPAMIRDSMILQRDQRIKIWGWASAGERINLDFNKKTYQTKADANGNWLLHIPPTKAGGPYTLTITATNQITIHDILFGDVWFCSGQSNMVHQLDIHDVTYAKDIATANYPDIRQFWVPTVSSLSGPLNDLPAGYWRPAVGEQVRPFSAVAFFFAKKIHEKYNVPVGIINASAGGMPVESWISEEGMKQFPADYETILKNKDSSYVNPLLRNTAASISPVQPPDQGMMAIPKWFDPAYIPAGWHNINVPGYWEDQGVKDLNGVAWYRREIEIPASMSNKPARVFLGRIVDADELYINGKRVGGTSYQYPQRRYSLAPGTLKTGKNIFVVRVTNTSGKGGFVPDKPYCIFGGTDTVDLKGTWQYKVGATYKPGTSENTSRNINPAMQPAALFNAMVAPETNYAIKGFCWYQGEANTAKPKAYEKLLATLISDWRAKWGQGQLPFLFVQLPGFMEYNYLPMESNWALLRESQRKALAVPNTAMAVAIDLGEWNDIHPDNKKDVGERLALAALKLAYNENIIHSGPLFDSLVIEGNRIIISFTNTGTGLTTKDGGKPSEFAIAGADRKFVWADTRIEGNRIVAWSNDIAAPKYIRYAYADNPVNPNLYNKEGLPASPFRTDD